MADKPQERELTIRQELFLEALCDEAKGDIRTAMTIAGYSKDTKIKEVVGPLKDLIVERTTMMLAMNAPRATHGIMDVMNKPSTPGARNVLQAAKEVLDRSGVVKKEQVEISAPTGGMFVLPPKKPLDDDGTSSID
jgi:hypothetical protein